MAETREMVQIEALEKYFGEDKERVHVLKGVTLNIPEGSLYTFLGPSGCGKTTTLRCIAGFERPDDGRILFGNRDVTRALPEQRDIGMVFQSYALFPHMTVAENLSFGLEVRKVSVPDRQRRIA